MIEQLTLFDGGPDAIPRAPLDTSDQRMQEIEAKLALPLSAAAAATASFDAPLQQQEDVQVNEAAIYLLQKLPGLDQAVLSAEATKKLIVANCKRSQHTQVPDRWHCTDELYGPLRLKAFNDAINSMHAGTQDRCRC